MSRPETAEFEAFVSIADSGSLSRAAKELGVPRATLSRRLTRLEDGLGVRLVHRTTRRLHLTESGQEYYQHAREILEAVDFATRAVSVDDGAPRGLLRVSAPPIVDDDFYQVFLDFAQTYPEVQVELITTTEHQDIVGQNIDVALRAGPKLDPGLIGRVIRRNRALAVASPQYLKRCGSPTGPADLRHHACLVGFARGERAATHWPLLDGRTIRVAPKLASNDVQFLVAAALRGHGVSLLPDVVCDMHLQTGALVHVLPNELGVQTQLALVYAERRLMRPVVRGFVDFAASKLGDAIDSMATR